MDNLTNILTDAAEAIRRDKSGKQKLRRTTVIVRGDRVREIRASTGMTQSDFADTYGLPVATLRNIEQGHRSPDTVMAIYLELIGSYPNAVSKKVSQLNSNRAPEIHPSSAAFRKRRPKARTSLRTHVR